MRFLKHGASGAAGMAGLIATVAAAAGTGTAVSAITFGGLQGGTWTISSNSFFTIDSATGVVKTTATPTVSGTTYTPTVTMTYAQSGLNVTASGVMSILASTAPTPTPTPTPGHTFVNTEAAAYVARMTVQPANAHKARVDEFFSRMKVNASGTNLLTALDILLLGGHGDAQATRLNAIADQYNAVVEGAPVFVANRGYTLIDSTLDALSFGVGATALTQFQQNSASMGFWGRNHTINQSLASIGNIASSGSMIGLSPRNSSGLMASRINSASATSGAAVSTSWGLNVVDRSSSTSVQHYKNGATNGSAGSATSSAKSSTTLKLRGLNQHIVAFFGRSMTAAEHLALYDAIAYYVSAVGITELVPASPTWASEAVGLLPDGVDPYIVGKGLNGLGFVRDPIDGTWWIARGIGTASLTKAGVAHLSADFSTVLSDWTLTAINATDTGGTITDLAAGSCQGIAYDTSDNTLYVVNKIANQLFRINKSGVLLSVNTIGSAANGCTYDAIRDKLVIGFSGGNIVWSEKTGAASTGSAAKSIQFSSTEYGDQIMHDAANDTIYMSKDQSQSTDHKCEVWPISSADYPLPYRAASATLPGNRAIEGVHAYAGKLYTVSDGAFHDGNTGAGARNDNNWRRYAIA